MELVGQNLRSVKICIKERMILARGSIGNQWSKSSVKESEVHSNEPRRSSERCEKLLCISYPQSSGETDNLAIYPARGRLDLGRRIAIFPSWVVFADVRHTLTCPPLVTAPCTKRSVFLRSRRLGRRHPTKAY